MTQTPDDETQAVRQALSEKAARRSAEAPAAPGNQPAASPAPGLGKSAKSRPDRAGKVQITGYYEPSLKRALQHLAIDQGKSLQEVVEEALRTHLRRGGP